MEDNRSRMELIEQNLYYESEIEDLEDRLDELELENDNLKYELYELKGDKDEE